MDQSDSFALWSTIQMKGKGSRNRFLLYLLLFLSVHYALIIGACDHKFHNRGEYSVGVVHVMQRLISSVLHNSSFTGRDSQVLEII